MGFSTNAFLFFFLPAAIIIFLFSNRLSKGKTDRAIIVLLDILFYSWGGWETLLLFILWIVIAYLIGHYLYYYQICENSNNKGKTGLILSVLVFVGFLVLVKYAGFLFQQINSVFHTNWSALSIMAPLGVSFLVFETVSYLADIYLKKASAGSLIDVAIFLSFFPKIISGPIVLWRDFQNQFIENKVITRTEITNGLDRIVVGLAKKVILADSFGALIQKIENNYNTLGADRITLWLQAFLYFFQIYYDFSGYSDIAIGISYVFGIYLPENFSFPYTSISISEFWRRWHISLGRWFREYVYIPMGGNRKGNVYLNLFVVFLLTGIWHGAGWKFIMWGVLHGVCVVIERRLRDTSWYQAVPTIIKWFFTMSVVGLGWILFSSAGFAAFLTLLRDMIRPTVQTLNYTWRYYLTKKTMILLVIAAFGSVLRIFIPKRKLFDSLTVHRIIFYVKPLLMLGLFALTIIFVVNSSYSPFLYFQF
ncbi:MAG: MBOAT family protein [Lachnospiraceae bacterium]|nr:MBOAT family protein [Lachnospiraceae bacterium]